ncbi:hypothetical protein BCF44_10713 [Kutzneria buriramensis]|uniref:Uncharacterized protein n=1 Tax=Kutzneria buriramensis TaxID=1045776 RepID=A0A3E0HHE8_9PSEU|nr:hypothetical protein BCF44_10713 [Kutzneria buriramensis]
MVFILGRPLDAEDCVELEGDAEAFHRLVTATT